MIVSADKIAHVLGGHRTLGRRVKTTRDLETAVRDGIPKDALDALVTLMSSTAGFENSESMALRNKIVPRATYQRVDRINLQVSETI